MAQGTLFGRIMLALVRIAVGWIFFFFGQYKIANTKFVHEGFAQSVQSWIAQGQPVHWLLPVLNHYVLMHPQLWARVIAWSEMLIAVSLILGLWVRAASLGGILFMSNAGRSCIRRGRTAGRLRFRHACLRAGNRVKSLTDDDCLTPRNLLFWSY